MNALVLSTDTENLTGLLNCHPWLRDYDWNNTTDIHDVNRVVRLENLGGIGLLCVVMVLGTLGNVPVLYIYGRRFKKSAYRFHILLLASTNYVTSCVLIPGNILFLANPLLEFANIICKGGVMLFPLFAVLAGYILFMIAVDRYLATCRSEKQHMTTRSRLVMFSFGIVLAIVLSWPMVFLYKNVKVDTGINGITATRCLPIAERVHFLAIMNAVWTTFSLLNAAVLITLYTLIIRKIIQSQKQFKALEARRLSRVVTKRIQKRKTTLTLFVVTIVALVANLPGNLIGIIVNSREHHDCDLSLGATIVLRMLIWVRLVSPAVNPFLYGFSDHRFRRELRNFFRRRLRNRSLSSVSSISQTF